MRTGLYWEHENEDEIGGKELVPSDWEKEWGELCDVVHYFECDYRLEKGDEIDLVIPVTDGEQHYGLVVLRTIITVDASKGSDDIETYQDVFVEG